MDSVLEHWKWITGSGATVLTGWLARRGSRGLWSAAMRVWNANKLLGACEAEKDYLRQALTEMIEAGELVARARQAGLIQTSPPSSAVPAASPAPSTSSPPRPPEPPETP